jgi:glycosyltransferase involved in cell wall biosynthesis
MAVGGGITRFAMVNEEYRRPPSISVVIPTRGRPELVGRAIASALRQDLAPSEILVVVDGPDPATETALAAVRDPRLRVIVRSSSEGAAAARNHGVEAASGEWIAFLDDDDEWLPEKLARQFSAMEASGVQEPIASCAILLRGPAGITAWRTAGPRAGEPIGDYLFIRRSLRRGEGTVGTSTIVARRSLLARVPFDAALARYQDADWLLRAAAEGARLVFCPDRLSIWQQPHGASITRDHAGAWQFGLEWIQARRHLVSRRAYAAFVLVRVAALAADAGAWRAAPRLLRDAATRGRPGPLELFLFAGRWLVPSGLRRALRQRFVGQRGA